MCELDPSGRIRWCTSFLNALGNNRRAAARLAAAVIFGFGRDEGSSPLVGKQPSYTFTPNMPGDIDVSEQNAVDSARFTQGLDNDNDKRWFDPALPVEFFRDLRRAVLVSARIPERLVIQWRDDVGLAMYDELYQYSAGERARRQKNREAATLRARQNAARAMVKKRVSRIRREKIEKVEEYGQYLAAKRRERIAAKKEKKNAGKIDSPVHSNVPLEGSGIGDDSG